MKKFSVKKVFTSVLLGVLLLTLLAGCTDTASPSSSNEPTSSTSVDASGKPYMTTQPHVTTTRVPVTATAKPNTTVTVNPSATAPISTESNTVDTSYVQATDATLRASLLNLQMETGVWSDKIQANMDYIDSLNGQKFLYYYYETAGVPIPNGLKPYAGCESDNIPTWHGGMTMGHYVSANAMLYALTGEQKWKDNVTFMINELEKCQQPNGYLYSKPEELFTKMEQQAGGEENWGVLYYYIHKVMAGLVDAYKWCGNRKALTLAENMSKWINSRMSVLTDNQRAAVLRTEYGGMNEVLYNLYAITKNPRDKQNAEYFNEAKYLNAWANGTDNLNITHANTTVPKAVGFIRGYQVTGDRKLLNAAVNFWEMTAGSGNRIFATGGMSEREIMGAANSTSKMFYDCPSETCVSYNMLKLSQYLYETTGNVKYVDYMERVLLNSLMGSIDNNGCKTYYQWLGTDQLKLFHTEFTTFWCCTGTGLETFSKVPEACWHRSGNKMLFLNIFISSSYTSNDFSIKLVNDDAKNVLTIQKAPSSNFTLKLRVPYWSGNVTVSVNGKVQQAAAKDGYITLTSTWKAGHVIEYTTPYKGYTESTPDNKDVFAIKYGPYVLAAVDKRYELGNRIAGSFSSGYLADLTSSIKRTSTGYELTTPDFKIQMKKYGEIVNDCYTVYFKRINSFTATELKPDLAMRATLTSSTKKREFPKQNSYEREFFLSTAGYGAASYLFPVHDGIVPTSSTGIADSSKYMTSQFMFYEPFFKLASGERWLCYTFDKAEKVSSSSVFFCNNTQAGISFPTSWRIEYLDGATWKPVSNTNTYTIANGWNTVNFNAVTTTQIRIVMNNDTATGVYEWKVS